MSQPGGGGGAHLPCDCPLCLCFPVWKEGALTAFLPSDDHGTGSGVGGVSRAGGLHLALVTVTCDVGIVAVATPKGTNQGRAPPHLVSWSPRTALLVGLRNRLSSVPRADPYCPGASVAQFHRPTHAPRPASCLNSGLPRPRALGKPGAFPGCPVVLEVDESVGACSPQAGSQPVGSLTRGAPGGCFTAGTECWAIEDRGPRRPANPDVS